jgi:hypothetical protein
MEQLFFMPESPRWLMANGKQDQALALLVKYRKSRIPPLIRSVVQHPYTRPSSP